MALKIGDRVRENTSSTGVGGLSLTGAPAGFQRFSAVLASGDVTYYSLEENDKFEVGIGTYGSNNLERTTVLSSSNSGDKISLGGSGVVFITYPADKALFTDVNDQFVLGASGLLFANGTTVKEAKLVELTDVNLSGTPTQDTVFDLNITNKSLSLGDMTGATNTNNVLIGFGAASGITNAQHNVVIGSESSGMNKTGSRNVYVGSNSGPSDASASTSTYESVAVGCDAGNLIRQQSTVMGYTAGASSYEIGFTAIGYQAGTNVGSYSTTIGYQAGTNLTSDYSVCLGYRAGYNSAGSSSVWLGRGAGTSASSSTNTIGIGIDAGKSSSASECIYIGDSAGESNSVDNLIFIGNASPSSNGTLIKGDMSNKRVAIGAADVTLDDTLFVGINSATDEGVVVKGHAAQSANLTSWKNNSDGVLAAVSPNGIVSANGIHATGNGVQLDSSTPASTANKLYRVGSDLYWNGAAVSAAAVGDIANYASGQAIENEGLATYASGQAIENESDILAVSGIAAYASGVAGGGGDVTTAQLNYVSGIAVYSSGLVITNEAEVTYASGLAITNEGRVNYASGLAITNEGRVNYASGLAITNEAEVTYASGLAITNEARVNYASGQAIENEGLATYASGQAIQNEVDILYVSGVAAAGGGGGDVSTAQLNYVSGIAVYSSGLAISNEAEVTYASGLAITNEGRANYASGLAITNEGRVNYASGQAISNESDIVAVSGIATNKFTVTASDSNNYTFNGMGLSNGLDPDLYLHKGHTYYFDKQTASHPFRVSATDGGSVYQDAAGNNIEISGQGVLKFEVPQNAPDKLYYYCTSHSSNMKGEIYTTNNVDEIIHVSGISAYASGLAITNEAEVTYASGLAITNEGRVNYASGLAITNEGRVNYASGLAITNELNVAYASGQAIENETDIGYVSGIAVYTSGVAAYASGQAIENEGLATYASGNTQNIAFGSNAEGDILIHNGSKFTRLAKGTDDYILKMNGNLPNWEAESGGSSLTAGSGIVVDGANRINVHGGTGNLQEIQLTSNNIFTPKMVFTGSGVQDTPVTMKVLSSHAAVNTSGTALSFEGTQGQLFGITDNLSSGNIFSVADITGLPLISADASGDVKLGEYGRYVGVGTGVPLYGFDVSSSGQFQKGFVLSNYVPATTTNTLYNEGGTLKFNGSAVGGGVSGDTFATDLKIGRDSQNLADFATTDNKIILRVNNINQVSLTDNVFGPEADSDVDLGTTSLRWKDAYVDSITVTGEIDGDSLDIEGDADINGTTNLDAVDIDGNVQIDGTVTVGVDDTGKDVKFFGATAGSYFEWDESEDRLNLVGAAYVQEAVPANDTPTAEDATITLDLKKGNYHNVSLGNNVTKFEFTNAKRGQRFILRITQNASSAKTVAWTNVDSDSGGTAATVRWAGGGTAPTMSTSTSHTDVYGFLCTNNAGSAFDGFVIGQDLPD